MKNIREAFLFAVLLHEPFIINGFVLKSSLLPRNVQVMPQRNLLLLNESNVNESNVIDRLDLTSKFSRWKFLQDTLEEDSDPQDVNEILYKVLKSFYDNPRPLETEEGVTNPSPRLSEAQRSVLEDDLFEIKNSVGVISILPTDGQITDESNRVLELLETFQPHPIENEDDFKSCWDIVVEMYGREATKFAQKNNDEQFKFRSSIVRLLLHFDFLMDEEIGE